MFFNNVPAILSDNFLQPAIRRRQPDFMKFRFKTAGLEGLSFSNSLILITKQGNTEPITLTQSQTPQRLL